MEPIQFTPKLSSSPNLPFLRSALVEIGEELDRGTASQRAEPFSPFGALEGFRALDPEAEMVQSLRLVPKRAGILRFGHERLPGLSDLPRLTVAAARSRTRPRKTEPVAITVTPDQITVTEIPGGSVSILPFDELQNVRVDGAGRFFFMMARDSGPPLCLRVAPWVVLALGLLMVGAARRGGLKELEAEIERKARSL